MKSVVLFAVLLFLSCCAVPAATLRVPGEYASIHAGLTAAAPGDTVLVASGVYYEHDIVMRSGVCLTSETGNPASVIIDAQQQGRVITCTSVNSDARIAGLTMTGGVGPGETAADGGGGIYGFMSSPAIEDCVFTGNTSTFGGGACFYFECYPEISNCTFVDNTAEDTGGGMSLFSALPTLTNCEFSENEALYGAGGLYCYYYANAMLSDCRFEVNEAISGGALSCKTYSDPTFESCVFMQNSAIAAGGAVHCNFSSPIFVDTQFVENSVPDPHLSWGGAVAAFDSAPTFADCRFVDNVCGKFGGAVMCERSPASLQSCSLSGNQAGAIRCNDSSITMIGCTLAANHGVPLIFNGSSMPSVQNCIIALTTGGAAVTCDYGGSAELRCCDVYGNEHGDWVACIEGQLGVDGNIHEDPLFCLDDNPTKPYTLHANSPCAEDINVPCGHIGAWGVGCGSTPVETMSWGTIKAMYR